jgi:hypothetical protein
MKRSRNTFFSLCRLFTTSTNLQLNNGQCTIKKAMDTVTATYDNEKNIEYFLDFFKGMKQF